MSKEIVNRIASSKLITIDLEDFYPKGERVLFDIKDWLFSEVILKEKDFRNHIKNHDWTIYRDQFVALICSSDAIIPSWAYLLITVQLSPFAKKVVVGNLDLLETSIFQEIINDLPLKNYQDKYIILKGCSKYTIPQTAYTLFIDKLIPICASIMYGEACSNVPIFKRNKP